MPRTILCQKCGVVLNIPDRVPAGKRLKCPGCGHRFALSDQDASSESTTGGQVEAAMASSQDIIRRPPSVDDLLVPLSEGDLRETFNLPSMTEEDDKPAASRSRRAISDAEALFQEEPRRKKKTAGAEARSEARRCKSCGGFVPKGMSICANCGTDQDTGLRVGLEDVFAPPPQQQSTGPPIHIAVSGLLCGLGSLILLVLSLVQSVRSEPGISQYGWLCLALVSAFGVYGAVQFLMGKTSKLLMIALTLGVFIDIMALIALPIIQANFEEKERVVSQVKVTNEDPRSGELEEVEIKPIEERLDQQKITLGLTFVVVYAGFSIYLMSPPVKRYFIRQSIISGAIQ